MKKLFVLIIAIALVSFSQAQTFLTRNGRITFFSKSPLENIEAINNEVTSILDLKKGELVFAALIKSFKFKKALMEEHFNENYMESNTFPKAIFKGNIINLNKINFNKDGSYPVTVKGNLTLHGVVKAMEVPGTINVTSGKISAASTFNIKLKEYNIKIPAAVENKIAETISLTVDCKYDPLKKDK